ncbi:hypothetical protein [Sulfitobacter sp. S190]|uniref:hypothetical protein n=1 Tax=Sulfitobacter sp. S190 TaxID=2867022 RepID=UPI0021A2C86C|nr:hypothetical protein [Sulfitobacter sp. S190]UWR22362.1 hypothetical protein K3756_17135 [Sulfitobacter sp. S190]
MKRLYLVIALVVWVLPAHLWAQASDVRSGEHPNFTRLTFPIAQAQDWNAKLSGQTLTLSFPARPGRFDTSDVFNRIGRDRLSKITQTGDSVEISLSCACDVGAFRSGGLLVIDVADQGIQVAGTLVRQTVGGGPPTPQIPPSFAQYVSPWLRQLDSAKDRISKEQAATEQIETAAPSERLAEMREQLAEMFSVGATTGVLTAKRRAEPTSSPTPAPEQPPEIAPYLDGRTVDQLRITSSRDLPGRAARGDALSAMCPPTVLATLPEWGSEDDFAASFDALHATLYSDTGALDTLVAIKLAKNYLFFGFGAEARMMLNLIKQKSPQISDMELLADLLDHGSADAREVPLGLTACDGPFALWATLANTDVSRADNLNADAAIRTLSALPSQLRRVFAPVLSERFTERKQNDYAEKALRTIDRLPDAADPAARLSQARIDAGREAPDTDNLEDLVSENSSGSPQALVLLARTQIDQNQPISQDTITLIAAYAKEHDGTVLGQDLRETEIAVLGHSGQFSRAFEKLSALTGIAPSQELMQMILENLVSDASDGDFLTHAFDLSQMVIDEQPATVRKAIAERLLRLGFPSRAQRILAKTPEMPLDEERQLLLARAAIDLNQPFQALAELIKVNGPRVDQLTAEAMQMTGSYAEAADLYAQQSAGDAAEQAAFLAGNWQALAEAENSGARILADLLSRPAAPDEGPLTTAQSAAEESAQMRSALRALLQSPETRITDDP